MQFHSEIQNDHAAMAKEEKSFKDIPVIGRVSKEELSENYEQIKRQVADLVNKEVLKINDKVKGPVDSEQGNKQQSILQKKAKPITNKNSKSKKKVQGQDKPMSL